MRRTAFALAVAIAFAVSPLLAGEGTKGDWELGLFAGFAALDDYGGLNPEDDQIRGARVGGFIGEHWGLEFSFQRLRTRTDIDPALSLTNFDVDLDGLRLNFLWNFRGGERFQPFLTAGVGRERTDLKGIKNANDFGYNAGGGVRWFWSENFGIRLDGRFVAVEVDALDETQGNVEGTLGLMFAFGGTARAPVDSDGDGVPDRKDKCPDTPAGATVDEKGCPGDADGDGVVNGIDACPDTPKGWAVDARGCPKDTDGDGVVDGEDTCPDTPRGAKVDAKGCPTDADRDGVYDGLDRCPDTPAGTRVGTDGCPLDRDGDGVEDSRDRCPDTPAGATVGPDGCPPPAPKAEPLFTAEKKSLVLEGVNFETNSATLRQDSLATLDKVAASMLDWPDVRVEIGGHTDSTGSNAHNLELSQRRAQSVKDYLVHKGVDTGRLVAKGYGEAKPIADNATTQGRARNRRVELTQIE
jgi:outer membrane protein OmpA-like peptidoglycan-associated protein/opacity protein-like surface antigen